jgi:hypothetical protein
MEIDAAYRTQYVLRKDDLLAKVQRMCQISVTHSLQAFGLILCFKSEFTVRLTMILEAEVMYRRMLG